MQRDTSGHEILYALTKGEYNQTEVGGIRTKTIRAGDSLEVESFPITRISQEANRERRRRRSTPAQQKLNERNRRKHIRRLLEANFVPGDLVLHLTFDYGFVDRESDDVEAAIREMEELGYPMDDEDMKRILRNFIARVKRLIQRRGGDPRKLKYLYVIETTREPRDEDPAALPARYHVHMVLSAKEGRLTAEDMQALWPYGYTKAEPLDFRFNGLEGLANYITKQRKHERRWGASKNLAKPDVRVSDRKISRRRAAQIAQDVQYRGREILEKIYPGYEVMEVEVRYSDFVAGAYIYARLRKRQSAPRKRRVKTC